MNTVGDQLVIHFVCFLEGEGGDSLEEVGT